MLTRSVASVQRVLLPVAGAGRAARLLHVSPRAALPRARGRARPPPGPADAAPKHATPWFMQETVVEGPAVPDTSAPASPIAWIPAYTPSTCVVPDGLAHMLDMLVTGSLRALVAAPTPAEHVDESSWGAFVRAAPIAVIRPMGAAAETAEDWIIVVQVRGNSVGTVRRVASELGGYLRHTAPPRADADATPVSLDALLGKPVVVQDGNEAPAAPKGPRPAGMSRIEHEAGRPLPPWQVQKMALANKFPDGWTPMTKLSHEAQDGVRLLHDADPARFSVRVLSERFRISPESVRRILKARWRPSEAAAERQNRRANTLEEARGAARGTAAREQDELAALRGEEPARGHDACEPVVVPARAAGAPPRTAHEQPVRFEGLVSNADLAAGRQRQKGVASRGSGDWCLIDAGWCVVHVMTVDARARYRLEDIWRDNGLEGSGGE
ncbi:asparagine--tRNA ligase [Malassezia sp. CBS 17886]|nr:asparagine--tRNA ligase [Malassezia sp. CBS 17886]